MKKEQKKAVKKTTKKESSYVTAGKTNEVKKVRKRKTVLDKANVLYEDFELFLKIKDNILYKSQTLSKRDIIHLLESIKTPRLKDELWNIVLKDGFLKLLKEEIYYNHLR